MKAGIISDISAVWAIVMLATYGAGSVQAREDPGCRGFMYTTWQGDYSQEKLEAFGRLWRAEGR